MKWRRLKVTSPDDLMRISNDSGVYCIYSWDDEWGLVKWLVYIGSSKNLRNRIKQHLAVSHSLGGGFNLYFTKDANGLANIYNQPPYIWDVCYKINKKKGEHLTREYRLIQKLAPPCNIRDAKQIKPHKELSRTTPY